MFVGGDITEISYSHPTLGKGTWYPKAGEDFTLDPGGMRTNDDDQGITGNGQAIWSMNNKRWAMEGTIAWDMSEADTKNEVVTASSLANSPVETVFTFTHINGTIYGGKGKPVGDIKGSMKDATMSIKLAGGSVLAKQSS